MIINIIGPPGSGKGTQSKILSHYLKLPHISVGDLLRKEVRGNSVLGKQVEYYFSKGINFFDHLTYPILKKRLSQIDCENGFILEGFPRNIQQLMDLKGKFGVTVDLVVFINFIEHDINILYERVLNRISCTSCGKVYNLKFLLSSREGICDYCNQLLFIREDDSKEKFKKRLREYNKYTKPAIDLYFYSEFYTNKFIQIDGKKNIGAIHKEIINTIKEINNNKFY